MIEPPKGAWTPLTFKESKSEDSESSSSSSPAPTPNISSSTTASSSSSPTTASSTSTSSSSNRWGGSDALQWLRKHKTVKWESGIAYQVKPLTSQSSSTSTPSSSSTLPKKEIFKRHFGRGWFLPSFKPHGNSSFAFSASSPSQPKTVSYNNTPLFKLSPTLQSNSSFTIQKLNVEPNFVQPNVGEFSSLSSTSSNLDKLSAILNPNSAYDVAFFPVWPQHFNSSSNESKFGGMFGNIFKNEFSAIWGQSKEYPEHYRCWTHNSIINLPQTSKHEGSTPGPDSLLSVLAFPLPQSGSQKKEEKKGAAEGEVEIVVGVGYWEMKEIKGPEVSVKDGVMSVRRVDYSTQLVNFIVGGEHHIRRAAQRNKPVFLLSFVEKSKAPAVASNTKTPKSDSPSSNSRDSHKENRNDNRGEGNNNAGDRNKEAKILEFNTDSLFLKLTRPLPYISHIKNRDAHSTVSSLLFPPAQSTIRILSKTILTPASSNPSHNALGSNNNNNNNNTNTNVSNNTTTSATTGSVTGATLAGQGVGTTGLGGGGGRIVRVGYCHSYSTVANIADALRREGVRGRKIIVSPSYADLEVFIVISEHDNKSFRRVWGFPDNDDSSAALGSSNSASTGTGAKRSRKRTSSSSTRRNS